MNGILIGSGPWECANSSGTVGGGCTPCGSSVCSPVSYTLQRFCSGTDCTNPGSGLTGHYFRSNGNLALWIWSGDTGEFTHDFSNLSVVRGCFGAPVGQAGCTHWQEGIGNPGGDGVTCCQVSSTQISIVNRFVAVNWIAPFQWNTSPPDGIAPLAPVLYEGTVTLNPASVAGCSLPYPKGGYDC